MGEGCFHCGYKEVGGVNSRGETDKRQIRVWGKDADEDADSNQREGKWGGGAVGVDNGGTGQVGLLTE